MVELVMLSLKLGLVQYVWFDLEVQQPERPLCGASEVREYVAIKSYREWSIALNHTLCAFVMCMFFYIVLMYSAIMSKNSRSRPQDKVLIVRFLVEWHELMMLILLGLADAKQERASK